MQHLIDEKKQAACPQPIRGFLWLLIGGEEVFFFVCFILLSWLAPSALLYNLEASLFLVAVALTQMLLVTLIFNQTSRLRERLLVSFRLLPSWSGIVVLVALAHFVVAVLCLAFVFLGSLLRVIVFPAYWWDMGSRFLLVSTDLNILFPQALRMMAEQGKRALKLRWFLAGWIILIFGWLIGGLLDFEL
jgi:hypothetical protein